MKQTKNTKYVRNLVNQDLGKVLDLVKRCANKEHLKKYNYNFDLDSVLVSILDLFDEEDSLAIGVFEKTDRGETLLGVALFQDSTTHMDLKRKIADEVVLDRDPELSPYQGAKIIHMLVNYVLEWFKDKDIKIYLPPNSPLQEYLSKRGFCLFEQIYIKVG
jgi:hypothetical protein